MGESTGRARRGGAWSVAAVVAATGLVAGGVPAAAAAAVPTAPTAAASPVAVTPVAAAGHRPWRWAEYFAQKPRWSTADCSAAARRLASAVTEASPGSKLVCTTVHTPLDWRNLTKGSATLHLTKVTRRVVKGDRRATRTLFVNPGGPGVTADWLAPTLATLEPGIARTHDVVAMDPRGTGRSTPVSCPEPPSTPGDPRKPSASAIATAQKSLRASVAACVRAKGRTLSVISTQQTIRDQDLARALTKANTIDYYGVSAGTWLGARYAELFPSRVGRFVLDSNTEFSSTWRSSFAWQPHGFQRRFDAQFLPWLARNHADWGLGSTTTRTRANYQAIRASLARRPVTMRDEKGRNVRVTVADFDDDVTSAMYTDDGFLDLAEELTELRAKVRTTRGSAAAPTGSGAAEAEADENTVFMAVTCNDSPWTKSASSYVAEGMKLGAAYPLIGYTWITSPCAYWPYPPQLAAAPTKRPTMLMVQTELDPATPLEGARRAHAATPNTRMISVDDQGNHGAFLGDNSCVEKSVGAYLSAGTLPPADSVCPGVPLPNERRVYPVGTKLTGSRPTAARAAASDRSALEEKAARYAQERLAEADTIAP